MYLLILPIDPVVCSVLALGVKLIHETDIVDGLLSKIFYGNSGNQRYSQWLKKKLDRLTESEVAELGRKVYRCNRRSCDVKISISENSIFKRMKTDLQTALSVSGIPVKYAADTLGPSRSTVSNWYRQIRELVRIFALLKRRILLVVKVSLWKLKNLYLV